jgi:hypothetical protein
MPKTKLETIVDKLDNYELPKATQEEIRGLIKEFINVLKETVGDKPFKEMRNQGLIEDLIAWRVESIGIRLAYEIAIDYENKCDYDE